MLLPWKYRGVTPFEPDGTQGAFSGRAEHVVRRTKPKLERPLITFMNFSLWKRFLLFFCPIIEHVDYEEGLVLYFKTMDGVTYLVGQKEI